MLWITDQISYLSYLYLLFNYWYRYKYRCRLLRNPIWSYLYP